MSDACVTRLLIITLCIPTKFPRLCIRGCHSWVGLASCSLKMKIKNILCRDRFGDLISKKLKNTVQGRVQHILLFKKGFFHAFLELKSFVMYKIHLWTLFTRIACTILVYESNIIILCTYRHFTLKLVGVVIQLIGIIAQRKIHLIINFCSRLFVIFQQSRNQRGEKTSLKALTFFHWEGTYWKLQWLKFGHKKIKSFSLLLPNCLSSCCVVLSRVKRRRVDIKNELLLYTYES